MTLVAITGARSPGVTTTAAALAGAWPGGAVLAEADPEGGTIAATLGVSTSPGLTTLAADGRRASALPDLVPHLRELESGVPALLAPVAPSQARASLTALGVGFAAGLAAAPWPVVVDCGRWDASGIAADIVASADLAVLVVRPTLASLTHATGRFTTTEVSTWAMVVIGSKPYRPENVAGLLGMRLAGVLADDPAGAAKCLVRSGARSALARSARPVAANLAAWAATRSGAVAT